VWFEIDLPELLSMLPEPVLCQSSAEPIKHKHASGVFACDEVLEPREPLLDLQQLLDNDDVGLLGVDPYRAVFARDQLFDLTVVRCGNLQIHVGNDTRDPHQLLELAKREAIMSIDASHPYVSVIWEAYKDVVRVAKRMGCQLSG
jgi:hypothetical protein